jgi:NAD(P)-dependent dehydrogenase (short-subunit alcohol dehydrogenase family)
MKDIRGSHAIVTGASRGIGTYIAKTLAAQGVSLTLAARDAAKLDDTRGVCEALGVRAIAVPTDVTSREDLRELVETAGRELGPIDILVNNAGIEITKSLQDTSFDEIDAVVRTNLSAPVWLISRWWNAGAARSSDHAGRAFLKNRPTTDCRKYRLVI